MVTSTPGGGCVVDINGGGHINAGARAGERLGGSKSSRSYLLTVLSHTMMTWGNGDGCRCRGDRWGGRDSGQV